MSYTVKNAISERDLQSLKHLHEQFTNNEWAKKYIETHQLRCLDDVKNIQKLNGNSILNIGGAPYIFEALALSRFKSITSLDLEPSRHKEVINNLGLKVLAIDIENPESRSNVSFADFDVVVLCEVLEHMRMDLIGTLRHLKTQMRSDSFLYLTTPNFFFFRRFFKLMVTGRSGPSLVEEWGKLEKLGHMGHVREYSKKELLELFRYTDFNVESVQLRNRSSTITKTAKGLLPSLVFTFFEKWFDLFAQEFVFVLRPKK